MDSEEHLIESIRRRLALEPRLLSALAIGPGDDAAVFKAFEGELVATTDLLSDEVDFLVGQTPPELIGRKAIAVNLSDLAAMGARPLGVVVSVLLPRVRQGRGKQTENFAERLVDGMFPILRQFRTALAGGDTNSWDGKLVLSVTAFGTVDPKKRLRRSGAKPGDRILTTGRFGGSILRRQFAFTPRLFEARYLNRFRRINAAMDVSDGLLLDLSRMAAASGVGFRIDEANVPIHPDTFELLEKESAQTDRSGDGNDPSAPCAAVRHALGDGEDFELILAVPPAEAQRLLNEQPFSTKASKIDDSLRNCATKEKIAQNFQLVRRELGFGFHRRENGFLLTDIGEFLPKEAGFLSRRASDGRTVRISQIGGWRHGFE